MTIDVAEGLVERVRQRVGSISHRHDRHDHVGAALCRCGHGLEVHRHFRPGSDCGICGQGGCSHFRPEH